MIDKLLDFLLGLLTSWWTKRPKFTYETEIRPAILDPQLPGWWATLHYVRGDAIRIESVEIRALDKESDADLIEPIGCLAGERIDEARPKLEAGDSITYMAWPHNVPLAQLIQDGDPELAAKWVACVENMA